MRSSNNSSIICLVSISFFIQIDTKSTISYDDFCSHIPSQARMINSSPVLSFHYLTSGTQVIGCSAGERPGTYLCFRSPIDQLKLRFPSTLPSETVDPAL